MWSKNFQPSLSPAELVKASFMYSKHFTQNLELV
jgi:hypothetical protein